MFSTIGNNYCGRCWTSFREGLSRCSETVTDKLSTACESVSDFYDRHRGKISTISLGVCGVVAAYPVGIVAHAIGNIAAGIFVSEFIDRAGVLATVNLMKCTSSEDPEELPIPPSALLPYIQWVKLSIASCATQLFFVEQQANTDNSEEKSGYNYGVVAIAAVNVTDFLATITLKKINTDASYKEGGIPPSESTVAVSNPHTEHKTVLFQKRAVNAAGISLSDSKALLDTTSLLSHPTASTDSVNSTKQSPSYWPRNKWQWIRLGLGACFLGVSCAADSITSSDEEKTQLIMIGTFLSSHCFMQMRGDHNAHNLRKRIKDETSSSGEISYSNALFKKNKWVTHLSIWPRLLLGMVCVFARQGPQRRELAIPLSIFFGSLTGYAEGFVQLFKTDHFAKSNVSDLIELNRYGEHYLHHTLPWTFSAIFLGWLIPFTIQQSGGDVFATACLGSMTGITSLLLLSAHGLDFFWKPQTEISPWKDYAGYWFCFSGTILGIPPDLIFTAITNTIPIDDKALNENRGPVLQTTAMLGWISAGFSFLEFFRVSMNRKGFNPELRRFALISGSLTFGKEYIKKAF